MNSPRIRRGDIHWVDWHPARGSEQAGRRPAVIIQTDAGNGNPAYPNTIVAAVSTATASVPTHVIVEPSGSNGLRQRSCVKCEQLVTISKSRLDGRIGALDPSDLGRVNNALLLALALPS